MSFLQPVLATRFFSSRLMSFVLSALLLVAPLSAPLLSVLPAQAKGTASPVLERLEHVDGAALQAQIKENLTFLYGKEASESLLAEIEAKIATARSKRSAALKEVDSTRPVDWYKNEVVYMLYPDRFGLEKGQPEGGFNNVTESLDYLEKLNVTTLYILPFMDSPMGDAGFDVSDFFGVRKDLGGNKAFYRFLKEAKKRGFKVKSDLILNHISEKHPWFQAALKGDKEKLDYFLYKTDKPDYSKYRDPQKGVVVDYSEEDGLVSSRRLMFPEQTESHYRKLSIEGKDYYFYHTFYPFQLDVNWNNPKLMLAMLDVISYWANLGVDIFRLDAVPYFIKEAGTDGENRPGTHAVLKILSAYLQATAPASVLQVEACQWPKDIRPYFGEPAFALKQEGEPPCENKSCLRTNEVQIAYNFPYMPAMWASLITGDSAPFWRAVDQTPGIPPTATWAVFLRVHDELTLEMVDLDTRKTVYEALVDKGMPFRDGLGVSGRLASFMDEDPRRIEQAFALLLSMPGLPIIYYGDELGMTNDKAFAEAYAQKRAQASGSDAQLKSTFDSRDINRNPVSKAALEAIVDSRAPEAQQALFASVGHLVKTRLANEALRQGNLQPLFRDEPGYEAILGYQRVSDKASAIVLHNLSATVQELPVAMTGLPANKATFYDAIADKTLAATDNSAGEQVLTLAPYQSVWITK